MLILNSLPTTSFAEVYNTQNSQFSITWKTNTFHESVAKGNFPNQSFYTNDIL